MDLVSARKYIEENIELLGENKSHLRGNARELFEFLANKVDAPLKRQEIHVINTINKYASTFDIRGLKMTLKNHMDLIMREDVKSYLTTDAKIVLEGMNAIR